MGFVFSFLILGPPALLFGLGIYFHFKVEAARKNRLKGATGLKKIKEFFISGLPIPPSDEIERRLYNKSQICLLLFGVWILAIFSISRIL